MAETVQMPKLGFDMAEGTLVRWVKAEGETVTKGDVLAEIETDKATVEVESPYSGVVNRQLVETGAVVPVGDPIAIIAAPGETVTAVVEKAPAAAQTAPGASQVEEKATKPAEPAQPVAAPGGVIASPLARKIAGDSGLDLRTVAGSGPGGRIVRKDVEAALSQPPAAPAPVAAPAATPVAPPAPKALTWTPTEEIPADQTIEINRLRAAIGKRMVESRQQAPHFYVTHVYDMDPLMALRKQINDQLPEGQKLSVNDFIVKGAALALREYPNLNAALRGSQIVRYGHINVGNAVALETGLLTVVVRDADQKPLRLIGRELRETVARARVGKVRNDDIEGSTFSISNLGMYQVDEFVAIINPPEAAILAVGAVQKMPVIAEDGSLKVGMRMKATLSADHRVTDGAEVAQFMQALGRYLENPIRLML